MNLQRSILPSPAITVWLLLFTLFSSETALSQGSLYRSGDVVRVSSTDTLQRQLFAAGEWVEIAGYLANDIYSVGNSITIEGTIVDDAFLAGETVTMHGVVGDMLVSAAGTLIIDGQTGGDLIAAARTLRLTENGKVGGNLFVAGNEIRMEGSSVAGRTRAAARSIYLDGTFADHVVIYSSDITFGPNYYSAGETKIVSNEPIYRDNLGVIPERLTIEVRRPPFFLVLILQTWFYLSLLVTGIVLLLLFRPVAEEMQRFAKQRFWKNTGIGFLIFLLMPLFLLLMMFPVITIPLAGLLGILYLIVLFVSYLFVATLLGLQFILWFRKVTTPSTYYYGLALGLIIIAIMNNLPVIGVLFSFLLLFFGVGSFSSYLYMRYKQRSDKKDLPYNNGSTDPAIENPDKEKL